MRASDILHCRCSNEFSDHLVMALPSLVGQLVPSFPAQQIYEGRRVHGPQDRIHITAIRWLISLIWEGRQPFGGIDECLAYDIAVTSGDVWLSWSAGLLFAATHLTRLRSRCFKSFHENS
jgi:hypothetical protein